MKGATLNCAKDSLTLDFWRKLAMRLQVAKLGSHCGKVLLCSVLNCFLVLGASCLIFTWRLLEEAFLQIGTRLFDYFSDPSGYFVKAFLSAERNGVSGGRGRCGLWVNVLKAAIKLTNYKPASS